MKKIETVDDVVSILERINKQTIKSYIADSGSGPIFMCKGRGLATSEDPKYYFGSEKISTKKVLEIISLVEKFPNDFVWFKHDAYIKYKHEDIYILFHVKMIIPGQIEKPKMIISIPPVLFSKDQSLVEKLELLSADLKNQERCKLFEIEPFECEYPSEWSIFNNSKKVHFKDF